MDMVRKAFAMLAEALASARHGYSTNDLDAECAYEAAVSSVSNAAKEVANALERHSEDNPVGKVEAVEGVAAHVSRAESVHSDESAEAHDGRVVSATKIHIPSIKKGKILLIFDDDGGDLTVEVAFIE